MSPAEVLRGLIVEDNPGDVDLIRESIDQGLIQFESAALLSEGAARARGGEFDVVLLDLGLPDSNGLATFQGMYEAVPDVPIVVLTGTDDEELAIEAMRAGAQDYLTKGRSDRHQLHNAIRYAVERKEAVAKIRRSEEALRVSEARFAKLSESGVVGIVVSDFTKNVHDANDASLRMLGYSREELQSGAINLAAITPPEWREADERAVAQLKATGVAQPWDKELFHKDGHRVPILIGLAMLDPTKAIAFLADMTLQRRAEEERRKSDARYRLIFEATPLAKWLYDVEAQRFVEVNDAAVRLYGYSRQEFLSLKIDDISPAEGASKLPAGSAEAALEAETLGIRRHRKKDGTLIDAEVTAYTFVLGDRKCRLVVVQDVTERRRLETQLHQAQKMDAVGRLAGGVAHDFNNMLAVILSYSHLLAMGLPEGDPTRIDLDEIRKAGERAASLTRQLLAFSRKQVLEPRPVDLNEVITQMDKMLRRLIGEDIELSTVPDENAAAVSVDPGQMEQVLMNLAVNARDAMPQGGKLTIETARVHIDETLAKQHFGLKPGPHVMLAVSDTGTGMDRATQARIFEPFFTTKEKGKGTGLGLSTVFGIVKQSGGGIWCYSELGKGTTFKIYLPRIEGSAESVARPGVALSTLRGTETILLVEDEEQVRTVAHEVLKRSGYHVIDAKNAGEALLTCEQSTENIELLLTDVVMPQMSGPEVAKRLVATRPGMKVLCMSGYTDEAIVNHGFLGEGVAFLQKPFTPEGLARKVREVLDARGSS
jgi:two-component system, cell cycle sensor histidine kinase and response regulator CckA